MDPDAQERGHQRGGAAQQRQRAQCGVHLQFRPGKRRSHGDDPRRVQLASQGLARHADRQSHHGLLDHRGPVELCCGRRLELAAAELGRVHLRPVRQLPDRGPRQLHRRRRQECRGRRQRRVRLYPGYSPQKDLPTTTAVPKSVNTNSERGVQKAFGVGTRRYVLNSMPLNGTQQVEAIVAIVSNHHARVSWRRVSAAVQSGGRDPRG